MKASDIIPAFDWLSEYDRSYLTGDLAAGATVGVMLIPQSMAYAVLAGMPPIYGLYASLVPLMVYAMLGTSRHLAVGPVAVDMLIVSAGLTPLAVGASDNYVEMAILLAALTGIVEIGMGLLRFGFMVNFLSRPVIAGFMTAAPIIIAASQLGNLLGVELANTQYVHILVWEAIQNYTQIHMPTVVVGGIGIGVLILIQRFAPRAPGALIWVVAAILASWGVGLSQMGVDVVGQIPEGLPMPDLQAWSLSNVWELAPTAVTLALVQFMLVMSLGQAFASEHKYSVDANRELYAVGFANLLGSFFRTIPVSGSFSRSAVNDRTGANTPLANVIAASIVGITLVLLTPLFTLLPIPALAAIIIVACIGMIDIPEITYLLQTRWIDGAVALLTFAATLGIGIQQGILIGVGSSILVVLYDLSKPNVVELGHMPGTHEFRDISRNPEAESISDIHILRIDSRFTFANAKTLKDELLDEADSDLRALILDCKGVNDLDTTASKALTEAIEQIVEQGVELYVAGAKGPVRDVMRRSGLVERIGGERFFLSSHVAVKELLRRWNEQHLYDPIEEEIEREELNDVRERVEEERERMHEDREDVLEEQEQLEEEVAEHRDERQDIDVEREQLEEKLAEAEARREELRSERQKMKAERERVKEDRSDVNTEREQLEEDLADHRAEREAIDDERERLEERLAEARARREELRTERERVRDRKEELAEEWERLKSDRESAADEKETLKEELDELRSEREAIDNKREQLESRLNEAEARKDELRSERQKIRQERERLEDERARLQSEREEHSERLAQIARALDNLDDLEDVDPESLVEDSDVREQLELSEEEDDEVSTDDGDESDERG